MFTIHKMCLNLRQKIWSITFPTKNWFVKLLFYISLLWPSITSNRSFVISIFILMFKSTFWCLHFDRWVLDFFRFCPFVIHFFPISLLYTEFNLTNIFDTKLSYNLSNNKYPILHISIVLPCLLVLRAYRHCLTFLWSTRLIKGSTWYICPVEILYPSLVAALQLLSGYHSLKLH